MPSLTTSKKAGSKSLTKDKEPLTPAEQMSYAMEHFKFIADQRTKTFNWYIILFAAGVGTSISCIQNRMGAWVLYALGDIQIVCSISFFWLDQRGKRLLNIARNSIEKIERDPIWPVRCRLSIEDRKAQKRNTRKLISFTGAFRLLFLLQLLLGISLLLHRYVNPSDLYPPLPIKPP